MRVLRIHSINFVSKTTLQDGRSQVQHILEAGSEATQKIASLSSFNFEAGKV